MIHSTASFSDFYDANVISTGLTKIIIFIFLFVRTCVQDVQDQMEDMLEQTNDIMETMGRPYGLPDDVDEDDLEAGKDGH